ncbi:MAG: hypothetical protein LC623_09800 [Halobacteriales archaeon]|nr:hypothetical protein [Halobacteriales archaeon]
MEEEVQRWERLEAGFDAAHLHPTRQAWQKAAQGVLKEFFGRSPARGTVEDVFVKAAAAVTHAAFMANPDAAAKFAWEGWNDQPEALHPPFLHKSIEAAWRDLREQVRVQDLARPARALHNLLMCFAILEWSVRPHLGLMVGLSRIAQGETPSPADIMLEGRGGRPAKIRSLGSMMKEFEASIEGLKSVASREAEALRYVYKVMSDEDDGIGLLSLRNLIGHLDLDLTDKGGVDLGFNRFRGKRMQSVPRLDLRDLERMVNGLDSLNRAFAAWSVFVSRMAARALAFEPERRAERLAPSRERSKSAAQRLVKDS